MLDMENSIKEKKVLLMLSGGRDSFLSACRLIADGYYVNMITYDNGHMSQTENAITVAERLINKFGEDKAKFVGVHPIAQNIRSVMEKALYTESLELCKNFPNLLMYQLNCLACHTTMYYHSIGYCIAHDIDSIAEGAREQQNFFVELPEMKQRYIDLCKEYNMELVMPVYDLKSDIERKLELAEWGFLPKSYEPQCWLGCPMHQQLNKAQIDSLALYFDQEIKPLSKNIIDNLVTKKKVVTKNHINCYE